MNKKIALALLIAGVAVAAIVFFAQKQKPAPAAAPEGGSTVTAPENDPSANWSDYSDGKFGFAFKYPARFGANVWRPAQWPPMVTVVASGSDPVAVGCPNIQNENGNSSKAAGNTPKGIEFAYYKGSDIGAGQLYSDYCYVIQSKYDYAAVIDFVIQSHSACGFGGCGAYCGTPYENECMNLNRQADIIMPIQQIIDTFRFTK